MAKTISDGVHASIAPKQIACMVILKHPFNSHPFELSKTREWNVKFQMICARPAFLVQRT